MTLAVSGKLTDTLLMARQIVYHNGCSPPGIMNRLCKIKAPTSPDFCFTITKPSAPALRSTGRPQFAAIPPDAEDLNVVGEPEVFYCRLGRLSASQPQAVMVTG